MLQIRGKRKRNNEAHKKSIGRTRLRPRNNCSQSAAERKAFALQRIRKYHIRSKHKMEISPDDNLSNLEKLPVELIEQIFFHALEMNMPLASRYLWQVLSTQPIFEALTIFAYFDDDGETPVETKHFLPAEYRLLSLSEKIYLQQSILSSSWCTYQHVKSCLPKLARLAMVQAWRREHALEVSLYQGVYTAQEPVIEVVNEAIRPLAALPNLEDALGLREHFIAPTLIENNLGSNPRSLVRRESFDARSLRIVTWTSSSHDDGSIHKTIDHALSILAVRHVPSWLLRSVPWTDKRLKFLQLLRQAFTSIQDDIVMAISAEAVFEGMANALKEHNIDALKTLLEIHNSFFRSADWNFQRMMRIQLTPPSNHPLPIELFHLAIGQGDYAASLLSLLLRAGIDSLPKDDEKVTAWALYESARGTVIASWLLKHMEGTSNYGLPFHGYLFTDGALSWRAGGREDLPFPDTSFADELGYIKGLTIQPAGLNGNVCGKD